ncbi:MAG TPA: phosphotransferase family protein [Myxococcota bacterium]|nr:phosphotransferase family protein [Myxococcota bacterium]
MTAPFASFKSGDLEGLVDVERLRAWLDARGVEPGADLSVRRISGGMSNESIGVERGGRRFVLRRPAVIALERADRGMEREFRMLTALVGTDVPHPPPIALCTDREVIGSAFYLMGHIDGFTSLQRLPEPFARDPGLQRDIALATADALGRLARVDWRARGLAGFGRPDGFHERQVGRWLAQLDSYRAREIPSIGDVGAWLTEHRPSAWTPGIMHGDYHAANVLVAPDPPARVAAILDWENCTIGDPLLDLAGFLHMTSTSERAAWAERAALIDRWERSSGRRAPDLRYYTALYNFKLAVMLEGVYQRSLADPTRGDPGAMGETVLRLAREAAAAITA